MPRARTQESASQFAEVDAEAIQRRGLSSVIVMGLGDERSEAVAVAAMCLLGFRAGWFRGLVVALAPSWRLSQLEPGCNCRA
jgi:hypothetical protein